MIGLHEAMSYCENLVVGLLTLLAGVLALYLGIPVVALLLCGTLLTAQCIYKLLKEQRGYEMLVVCSLLMAIGVSGATYGCAFLLVVLMAASVYDCYCHRRLRLTSDGVFTNRSMIDAEASRDIGMGGCVPRSDCRFFNSSGH